MVSTTTNIATHSGEPSLSIGVLKSITGSTISDTNPTDTSLPTLKSWKTLKTPQQTENPFLSLVTDQRIAIVPSFTLESGLTLLNVPLAFTAKGKLSPGRDNVMVICYALTGSAIVSDWWGPLIGGHGRAFDTSRFFIICINSLGSPYGSASPVTYKDGNPKDGRYGPEFPLTTIRDDVNIQKMLLDELDVRQVAAVIGGSMGGMLVLEWAYFGKDYVRCIIPIATSARHSAWGISWGEAQRQSIYVDPKYKDGYYDLSDPPISGLRAARMSALLTYRSRNSFETRFGRNIQEIAKIQIPSVNEIPSVVQGEPDSASNRDTDHSDKSASCCHAKAKLNVSMDRSSSFPSCSSDPQFQSVAVKGSGDPFSRRDEVVSPYFSAQSYLRYQGDKFVERFDANCYLSISQKLDTHDIARSRTSTISEALALIEQPTLVLGIESDGLFNFSEQLELASGIPNARLERIDSPEGHDAFLLQLKQVNEHILKFLKEILKDIMELETECMQEKEGLEPLSPKIISKKTVVKDITDW